MQIDLDQTKSNSAQRHKQTLNSSVKHLKNEIVARPSKNSIKNSIKNSNTFGKSKLSIKYASLWGYKQHDLTPLCFFTFVASPLSSPEKRKKKYMIKIKL